MKRMSKLTVCLLVAALASFWGCGSKDETIDKAPPPGLDARPVAPAGPGKRLGARTMMGAGKKAGQ